MCMVTGIWIISSKDFKTDDDCNVYIKRISMINSRNWIQRYTQILEYIDFLKKNIKENKKCLTNKFTSYLRMIYRKQYKSYSIIKQQALM